VAILNLSNVDIPPGDVIHYPWPCLSLSNADIPPGDVIHYLWARLAYNADIPPGNVIQYLCMCVLTSQMLLFLQVM
jgi:hypothetical protein